MSGKKNRHMIRKTLTFHRENDATILDYIEAEVGRGKDFTAVVRELLLQMITLHQFRMAGLPDAVHNPLPNAGMNLPDAVHNPLPNANMNGKLDDPFGQLEDRYG